jgi:outer membrane lipoprotein LolB
MIIGMIFLLNGCTPFIHETNSIYQLAKHKVAIKQWQLSGRLAIKDERRSATLSIEWQHVEQQQKIRLSGPLGQGATEIRFDNQNIFIDRGNGQLLELDSIKNTLQQQLGFDIPIQALSYWVTGTFFPDTELIECTDGFEQFGWKIHYLSMQNVNNIELPYKLYIEKFPIKLKLIIDEWNINESGK